MKTCSSSEDVVSGAKHVDLTDPVPDLDSSGECTCNTTIFNVPILEFMCGDVLLSLLGTYCAHTNLCALLILRFFLELISVLDEV